MATSSKAGDVKPRLIDSQNRVALPAEVLKVLGAAAGDYVAFVVEGKEVKVSKVRWELDARPRQA